MKDPRLELTVGATYKVDLNGDGVWAGEFTSKLVKIEDEQIGLAPIYWLHFENGLKMTYYGCGDFEKADPVVERKPVTLKLAMDPRTGSFTILNQSSEEIALFVEGTDHDPKVPYQMMPTTTFLYRREVKEKP